MNQNISTVNERERIKNVDKGRLLMAARKRMGLSQVQMAEGLVSLL